LEVSSKTRFKKWFVFPFVFLSFSARSAVSSDNTTNLSVTLMTSRKLSQRENGSVLGSNKSNWLHRAFSYETRNGWQQINLHGGRVVVVGPPKCFSCKWRRNLMSYSRIRRLCCWVSRKPSVSRWTRQRVDHESQMLQPKKNRKTQRWRTTSSSPSH
jgi:hypothetical protein